MITRRRKKALKERLCNASRKLRKILTKYKSYDNLKKIHNQYELFRSSSQEKNRFKVGNSMYQNFLRITKEMRKMHKDLYHLESIVEVSDSDSDEEMYNNQGVNQNVNRDVNGQFGKEEEHTNKKSDENLDSDEEMMSQSDKQNKEDSDKEMEEIEVNEEDEVPEESNSREEELDLSENVEESICNGNCEGEGQCYNCKRVQDI